MGLTPCYRRRRLAERSPRVAYIPRVEPLRPVTGELQTKVLRDMVETINDLVAVVNLLSGNREKGPE